MFNIYGNKTEFKQWEQGQMVTNDDMRVGDKVTFHDSTGYTMVMTAYNHNGTVVADVPNTMLATPYDVVVTLGNGATMVAEERTKLMVMPTKKPADYEFIDNRPTPMSLEKRVEALEAGGGGGGGVVYLNLERQVGGRYTCEYTFEEVQAMIEEGKRVFVAKDNRILSLAMNNGIEMNFTNLCSWKNTVECDYAVFYADSNDFEYGSNSVMGGVS